MNMTLPMMVQNGEIKMNWKNILKETITPPDPNKGEEENYYNSMTYDELHNKWHKTASDEVKSKRGDYPTYAEMAEDLELEIEKSDEYTPENMLEDMLESLKKVKMDEDDEDRFWRAAGILQDIIDSSGD